MPDERCVLARRGRVDERSDFFSILVKGCEEQADVTPW